MPFVIVSTAMLESEIYHYPRLTAQNVVFLAAVAALCALYVRRVEAPAAQKAFVIAVVMCYGYLASLVQFIISELLPLPNERLYETLRISMSMVTVVLIWRALRTVKIVNEGSRRRALLLDALERERTRRAELQSDLAAANRRVEELEERAASGNVPSRTRRGEESPVVLSSSHRAVSLLPSDIAYVESVNRMRIVHLADGESVRKGSSLGEIFSQLPQGRFAYCHRSVIVNLEMVRSVSPEGITLRDGTPVDTSRRRIPELREALARLHG